MPKFKLSFTEHNGEQEYFNDHVFDAHDLKDAEEEAHNYLMGFYGEGGPGEGAEDVTKMEEYWYDGGTICVRRICLDVTRGVKDNFTEDELDVLLEAARESLSDAEIYEDIAARMDLSDDYLKPLVEKLQKIMDLAVNCD